MPTAASRVCGFVGCGRSCSGRFCGEHAGADHRADRERRGSAASRGYGRYHERWRKLVLHRDPLCKIAHFCKGLAPATIADHVVPLKRGGDWKLENGQGACEPCHNWKTRTEQT
jgi:5-methylcytosine-specific restriction protein A